MAINFLSDLAAGLPRLDLSGLDPWMQMRLGGGSSSALPTIGMPSGSNILQQILAQPEAAAAPQAEDAEPPRKRRSFVDTLGRIGDVMARVGDRDPLYQPTLDAQADRARNMELQDLQFERAEQQVAEGADEATGRVNTRLGQAVRGLQAIQGAGGDVAAAWPLLARQIGLPDDRIEALGQIFATNPNAIAGVAAMLNGQQREFGMQPFYAADAQGNLTAYQLGRDGTVRAVELPEGQSPIDPMRFINTGGQHVGIGTRSGRPLRILPNTEQPGYRGGRPIAPPPVTSRGGTGRGQQQATPGMIDAAVGNLREIRTIYDDLHRMGAMVSPGRSTAENFVARARSSAAGQVVEGAIGTEAQTLRDRVASIRPGLMQSIARATGMNARQLDSNAEVRLFMQTVTDPTTSYEANLRAIEGLERFLRANSRREETPAPARPASSRRSVPRRITPPGGWGRATVVGN